MNFTRVGQNDRNRIVKIREHCWNVCRGDITKSHINDCLNLFDYCYDNNQIKGIITFNVDDDVEVTLLCSAVKKKAI